MNQQNMETRFPNLEVSPKHAGYLFMLFTCHRHHDSKCPLETIAHQLVWWSICGWYWASSDAVSLAKNSMGWIDLSTIYIPRLVIVTQCLQCLPGVNQFNLFLFISFITSWNMREKLLTCLFPFLANALPQCHLTRETSNSWFPRRSFPLRLLCSKTWLVCLHNLVKFANFLGPCAKVLIWYRTVGMVQTHPRFAANVLMYPWFNLEDQCLSGTNEHQVVRKIDWNRWFERVSAILISGFSLIFPLN